MAKKERGEDLNCLIKLFVKGFECLYEYNLKKSFKKLLQNLI